MSCILKPEKVPHPLTGKPTESILYTQLKEIFPSGIAQRIYNKYASKDMVEKFIQNNPGEQVLDELGQPTMDVIKRDEWYGEYLEQYAGTQNERQEKAQKVYGIGTVKRKRNKVTVENGTENFQEVANRIGDFHRSYQDQDTFTMAVHKKKVNGKWIYATEIVLATRDNKAALEKFIRGCTVQEGMKIALAKAGISSSIVDNLATDVHGEFDPGRPEKVMHSLFNLIRYSRNIYKDGGLTTEAKLTELEEMSHAFIAMFKDNPQTKESYKQLVEYVVNVVSEHPQILLKYNNLLSQGDLETFIQEYGKNINSRSTEEFLGKILAGILLMENNKTVTQIYNSKKKFDRVLNKADNIFKSIVEHCYAKVANSVIGTAEKTANITAKSFSKLMGKTPADKPFEWGRYKKDSDGFSRVMSIAERNFFDEVQYNLRNALGTLLEDKLDVTDIKRNGVILHRMAEQSSSDIQKVFEHIGKFYIAIDNMGIGLVKGKRNLEVRRSNQDNKSIYDRNMKGPLRRTMAAKNFLVNSLADLSDIVTNLERHLKELDDGFKYACQQVVEASQNESQLLTVNALELAANLKNFDKQIQVVSNASVLINQIDTIVSTIQQLADVSISSKEISKMLEPFNSLLMGVRGIYNNYSKAALTLQFGAINNGRLYIDRGARLMSVMQKNRRGKMKKKLKYTEAHKIPIIDLLSELRTSEGYFDISLVSYFIQSAANSTDPITQFVDRLTKQSKFTANRENARWHKAIIDFRNYCRFNHINTSKFFEVAIIDGKEVRTGNIVSNINWGLWEHDQEQNRRMLKAQGIAAYIAEQNGENFEQLSKDEQAERIQGVFDKENLDIWNQLDEGRQIEYLYKYAQKYYFDFHNSHSVNVNDIDSSTNAEQLPEGARRYDPTTDTFKSGRLSTQYTKATTVTDEKTGQEYSSNELSAKRDLNTRTFVPNLNFDNGRYRNKQWDKLSAEEKQAIQMYLNLKAELDAKLNRYQSGSTVLHRMPQFRGTTLNRTVTEGPIDTIVNSVCETIFQDSEDQDFGNIGTINEEESAFVTQQSFSSFEARQRLPMFGVNKLKDIDQLTTDVYRGLLSYAVMANNVEAMSNVAPVALLTKNVIEKRKINDTWEGDFSHIGVSDHHSYIYQRFAKYVEMQVFGRYTSVTEAKSGKRVVNWNKIFKKLSSVAAWTALAGNFIGGTINTGTGLWNIAKEAGVGQYFNRMDMHKAWLIYIGHSARSPFGSKKWNDNPLRKFVAYWDCVNKNEQRYNEFRTIAPILLKWSYEMCHYENGDNMIHIIPYIARALNTTLYKRVVENGEVRYEAAGNAWDIFVQNCDRMKDSEQIKATTEIQEYDQFGEPLKTTVNNELSMNPYAYTTTEIDPNTGKEIQVVRQYCTRTAAYTSELQKAQYSTKHTLQEYQDKQSDIQKMIDKNIELFKVGLQYNASYADTTKGKEIINTIRVLCNQYNKYEYLKAQAQYSKSGMTPKWITNNNITVDLELMSLDLQALSEGKIQIQKDDTTTNVTRRRRKSFSLDKFAKMADISNSDIDYEEFNTQSQAQWQDSCRNLCDSMHGIYNNLDGVVASQSGVGAMFMSMKKYYLGYILSQYQGSRDSLSHNTDVEGCVSMYWKMFKYSLFNKDGFYAGDKSLSARLKSGAVRGLTVGHAIAKMGIPLAAITMMASGAPITCALGSMLFLRLYSYAMQKTKWINQTYQSVTSNSQRAALQRAFRATKTATWWKMLGILFSGIVTKVSFDDDDKYLWEFYGKDDPRLRYPDIYQYLHFNMNYVPRNDEGELDADGKESLEVLDSEENPAEKEILERAEILKTLSAYKGREQEIDAVANMMIFANTKKGRALDKIKYRAYVASSFREDEKFFKWVAQQAHRIIPQVDEHMFDDYAIKMAQGAIIDEKGKTFSVSGALRAFTKDAVDKKTINLYNTDLEKFERLVKKGVIREDIAKALEQRESAQDAYAELSKYINKYNTDKKDKDAFVTDCMARLMNDVAYCDEIQKPTNFTSMTYLFDAIDYGSSRWLNEQVVLSPNYIFANPYDVTIAGAATEFGAQWKESFGGIVNPILIARGMDLYKWLGDISSGKGTSSSRSLENSVTDYFTTDYSGIDPESDYTIKNKPLFNRILAKYSKEKYSYFEEEPFLNSIFDLVFPFQKRLPAIQDFEKLKKQYHQMRNK